MATPRSTRNVRCAVAALSVSVLALSACGGDGSDADDDLPSDLGELDAEAEEELEDIQEAISDYPREDTVFTSGQQWGPPSSWNPIPQSGEATGVRGLLYEPLFVFDPEELELEPWLAESGEWVEDDVYELTLHEGIEWTDGEALTADDVVFTVELGENEEIPWSNVLTWLDSAEAVDDHTVVFEFSDPRPQSWDNFLYGTTILPEHIVGEWDEGDYMSNQNEEPVGSGPFLYSGHGQDRMVWERNEDWWGADVHDMEFPMQYIVDIVNPSNEVALGLLLQGGLDLSNNFLPGVNTLVESGQLETFYAEEPYMLSANTAMLIPNTEVEPLDDPEFRRALASSVDTERIVDGAYGGIVQAAHPSGLLPAYEEYWDDEVTEEHGFSYDPAAAEQILADAGYEDTDDDGFVETPDGDPIELELIVPAGWTDWMEAARVIADGAQEAGINVVADFPDAGALDDARINGEFELILNNDAQLENTPATYYEYVFRHPLQDQMWNGNFGRYDDSTGWDTVQELNRLESDDPAFEETLSELQELHLEELHMIPLWYNGMWAQYNTQVWTNWPTEASETPSHFPSTWGGYWEMGGLHTFAELERAE